MNWVKEFPQTQGEYLYVRYIECGCCIEWLGYVYVTPPVFDNPGKLTYNYINDSGEPMQMHFEGIRPEQVEYIIGKDGKIYVDAWCKYDPPDHSLISEF